MACDVQIAVHIAPHSVEAMIRKLDQQTFSSERTVRLNIVSPHIALRRFVDIERLIIRTHLDAVRRSHSSLQLRNAAVRIDAPELPGRHLPIWIGSPEDASRINGEIVRLTHPTLARKYLHLSCLRINPQNVVTGVICDIHKSPTI